MLTHRPSADNPVSPAATARVTTQELTKALAAIEARKEEESRRLPLPPPSSIGKMIMPGLTMGVT